MTGNWRSMFPGKKRPTGATGEGCAGLEHTREGWPAQVSSSLIWTKAHMGFFCALCYVCTFSLLCYHLVSHFLGCELFVCWHDPEYKHSNFCKMKLFLIKKLNYRTSSQKGHAPI